MNLPSRYHTLPNLASIGLTPEAEQSLAAVITSTPVAVTKQLLVHSIAIYRAGSTSLVTIITRHTGIDSNQCCAAKESKSCYLHSILR